MTTPADQKPVTPGKDEQSALDALDALLSASGKSALKLTDAQGHEIALPKSIVDLLSQSARQLAMRRAVMLVPLNRELTTQQAANLLNMSRPSLITLLEEGKIAYTKVGSHRRVQLDEVMRYKTQRDAKRKQALDELAQLNQELGLYGK